MTARAGGERRGGGGDGGGHGAGAAPAPTSVDGGGLAALGLGLGGLRALEQVGGDLAGGFALRRSARRVAAARRGASADAPAAAAALARASSARLRRCSGISVMASSLTSHHSGPEMPPSLRTRQKWIAMKMTITNGSIRTCSTYQRSSVSVPISAPPSSTKRTWFPNTGV